MKDKDLVALLTIMFFVLYFVPVFYIKIVSVFFILFFAPGFFTLRLYRKINREELILISWPLSVGISGLIALFLATFSILSYETMLGFLGGYIVVFYILGSSEDIGKIKFGKPSKFISVMIVLILVLISVWGYMEFTHPQYKEIDISIEKWPHNVTVGENVSFEIYVKNWNYHNARLKVLFRLNNHTVDFKKFVLSEGRGIHLEFHSNISQLGVNLASFDLYLNGRFYTNVHVYFVVNSSK